MKHVVFLVMQLLLILVLISCGSNKTLELSTRPDVRTLRNGEIELGVHQGENQRFQRQV